MDSSSLEGVSFFVCPLKIRGPEQYSTVGKVLVLPMANVGLISQIMPEVIPEFRAKSNPEYHWVRSKNKAKQNETERSELGALILSEKGAIDPVNLGTSVLEPVTEESHPSWSPVNTIMNQALQI